MNAENPFRRRQSGPSGKDEEFIRFKERLGITSAETSNKQEHLLGQPLMRNRFFEQLNKNKATAVANPGYESNIQLANEIQGDVTLTEEERFRQLEELRAVFSSFARNNRSFS